MRESAPLNKYQKKEIYSHIDETPIHFRTTVKPLKNFLHKNSNLAKRTTPPSFDLGFTGFLQQYNISFRIRKGLGYRFAYLWAAVHRADAPVVAPDRPVG